MPPPDRPPGHPDYRFTLANERTLLAYPRTGLALVAGGVAVAQYAPDLGVRWGSAVVALGLVVTGLGTATAGYLRWRGNERAIQEGTALPGTRLLPGIVAAVAAVIAVVAVLVAVQLARR